MTKREDIQIAVVLLTAEKLVMFRDWFEGLQARLWDQQPERR